jgi:hypothetical protein
MNHKPSSNILQNTKDTGTGLWPTSMREYAAAPDLAAFEKEKRSLEKR